MDVVDNMLEQLLSIGCKDVEEVKKQLSVKVGYKKITF